MDSTANAGGTQVIVFSLTTLRQNYTFELCTVERIWQLDRHRLACQRACPQIPALLFVE
ncbi:hypothetical protein BVI1335_990049 [Burkholderia vietnamiensis]|nr:hypothetical protein BVI1335_990049 [Burkholderia vietnamiensis]